MKIDTWSDRFQKYRRMERSISEKLTNGAIGFRKIDARNDELYKSQYIWRSITINEFTKRYAIKKI